MTALPPLTSTHVHHIGMSVRDIAAALSFWEKMLDRPARWRTRLTGAYLGRHVGYPGLNTEAAFIELPGGIMLELLEYQLPDRVDNPEATANPGNVHLCLAVADCRSAWERAVALGARPILPSGPVEIDVGPNSGARASYLRIHDGITLEFYQPRSETG
jgi:catechol 2,3-dioxygenase-like lactoylglutathione lyase family enzyme